MPQFSNNEVIRITETSKIESNLSGHHSNTAYVGNIPEAVTDEVMDRLLSSCGPVTKWKRVFDAANMPKSFGFCEFGSADAMNRALSILHELPIIGGKKLVVKIDDATKSYLQRYLEALDQNQVGSTSKEADLTAINVCIEVFKEKNFYTAYEAMEKKLLEMNKESPEEGEALSDEDVAPIVDEGARPVNSEAVDAQVDRYLDSRRRNSVASDERTRKTLVENSRPFREKESRWEEREKHIQQKLRRSKREEAEYVAKRQEDKEYMSKYLSTLDDFSAMLQSLDNLVGIHFTARSIIDQSLAPSTLRMPDFYQNRELWNSRRQKESQREVEYDTREEKREQFLQETSAKKEIPAATNVILGVGSVRENSSALEPTSKKTRMTAADLLGEVKNPYSLRDSITGNKRPLIANEVLEASPKSQRMPSDDISSKLAAQKKEKITALIRAIPTEASELFKWEVEWPFLDSTKLLIWIRKKVVETMERMKKETAAGERVANSLIRQIEQHATPSSIIDWIVEDGHLVSGRKAEDRAAAELFVAILWRYLVFETEAKSYNLQ